MNSAPPHAARPGISRRELALLVAALAVVVGILPAVGGSVLWTRPLWMDEIAMYFLTSEPTGEMIRLIGRGGDWNPPTLHLIVRGAIRLLGMHAVTPVVLRSIALVSVLLAVVFVYATLRRRVGIAAAVSGVLVLCAQGLVLEHAFEGRFYAPWLGFAAMFAWSLGVDGGNPRSRRRDALVALTALLVATIHWYGVFSLALMCAGAVLARRPDWRGALRSVAPAGVAALALVALVPLALSQRASAAPVLWVHPLSLAQVDQMTRQFVPGALVVLVALALVLDAALRSSAEPRQVPGSAWQDPSISALFCAGAMPLVLIGLSVALTPSMVFRYAIVATLAWAPAVALLVESSARVTRAFLMTSLAMMVGWQGAKRIAEQREFARVVGVNRAGFEQAAQDGVPVVFQRLHVIYPVAGRDRSPTTPARYIDISDAALTRMYPQAQAAPFVASLRLDRDQARYHAGIYGWPVMAPVTSLDTLPRFYLVATDATLPPGYAPVSRYGAALFPRHQVRRLSPVLSVFERQDASAR